MKNRSFKKRPSKPKITFESLLSKRIYDDVHGFVELTIAEKELLNSSYMRRLHFIKQNALANFVFPGATHTRFSHSIGVLHIVEKMVQKLKTLPPYKINISDFDHQIVRLAALLHDVGHYPLSHTIESSYKEYDEYFFKQEEPLIDPITGNIQKKTKRILNEEKQRKFLDSVSNPKATIKDLLKDLTPETKVNSNFHHELIAKKLITDKNSPLNKQVRKILKEVYNKLYSKDISNKDLNSYIHLIGQLVKGEPKYTDNPILLGKDDECNKYYILSLLINSDLDADQLDYMLRDTKNTGIQTTIRVDFLIDNMDICFKKTKNGLERILCFNYKAFESVQQFIFSKAYWYTEILLYNKVCILNEIAKKLVIFMLLTTTTKVNFKYKTYYEFLNNLAFDPLSYFHFNDDYFWKRINFIAMSTNNKVPKLIREMAILLISGAIPNSIPISNLSDIEPNNYFKTSINPKQISTEEKNKIYELINQKFQNKSCYPKFFEREFFKPKIGEENDRYAVRTINILLSPCTKSFCNGECINATSIVDSEALGINLLHKILGIDEENLTANAYVQKMVVYNFN